MKNNHQPVPYWIYKENTREQTTSQVMEEKSITLTVNGDIWLSFLCTPQNQEELALGFLFNENFIQHLDEVVDIRLCESGDNIDIWLKKSIKKPEYWGRNSGCAGGQNNPQENTDNIKPITSPMIISPDQVYAAVEALDNSQEIYHQIRGVHGSVLMDDRGSRFAAEDIGRHNTLDKIAGFMLRSLTPVSENRLVVTSGRISSEMLFKSARLQTAVLISRSGPSSLAIQQAAQLGITLVGYARKKQFFVYSHEQRIQ